MLIQFLRLVNQTLVGWVVYRVGTLASVYVYRILVADFPSRVDPLLPSTVEA